MDTAEVFQKDLSLGFPVERVRTWPLLLDYAKLIGKAHPEVEEIRVFGSYLENKAHFNGFIDLLLVLKESSLPRKERADHYLLQNSSFAVRLQALTSQEIAEELAQGNAFLRKVLSDSRWIYSVNKQLNSYLMKRVLAIALMGLCSGILCCYAEKLLGPVVRNAVFVVSQSRKIDSQKEAQAKAPPTRHYQVIFQGKALYRNRPASSTQVRVQVWSSQSDQILVATTDQDGHYSVEVGLEGAENEPLRWAMDAQTTDFQQLHLEGCQIATGDVPQIVLEKPLQFKAT